MGAKTNLVKHGIIIDELNEPAEPFLSFDELRPEVVIGPDHRGIYDASIIDEVTLENSLT
jgi:hypothetical protein